MFRTSCRIVLIIASFCTCRPDAQRCPSACTCSTETIGGKLHVSCDISAQDSGSDYSPFPTILPNNTRVLFFRVSKGDYVFKESDVSFADISWEQVEEITLKSVPHFQLNKTRLAGVPRLRVLRLQEDTLRNILHSDAFLLTPNIEVLDLSYNPWLPLENVLAALNESLPNLKYLDLSYLQNALSEPFILNKKFAMAIENKPLISLNVSNTKISLFEDGLTSESIRYLNLSYTSGLWYVRYQNHNLFPNLEELDISYTTFYATKEFFTQSNWPFNQKVPCLRYVLSVKRFIVNNMRMIKPIYFYDYRVRFKCSTIGMEELYLRYSDIRWLNVTINITLFNLKIVDLEGNNLEYLSPYSMKKAPNLREIYLSRNILSAMVNLGNLFEGNAELEIVDLSQNRLTSIPWTMFVSTPKLSILRLQGNSLSIFHISIEKLINLKLLDLRDNVIKYISRDTISGIVSIGNEQVRSRDIHFDTNTSVGNEIKALPRMNNSVLMGESATNQLAIDLTGNLMECTCDRIWFNEWIFLTNIPLLGKHLYKCKFDNNLHYMTYELLNDLKYHCKLKDFLGLIIATPCSIFLTIVFVYVIIRKRRNVKRRAEDERDLIERYNKNENIDRQRYFVFLSYAGKDVELVNNYIYPKLDLFLREKFGNSGNLICTGDTHFTPGRWIAEEIDRCLNRCDVFVMVVTKHFIESEWCKYEVIMAKQKNKFKILLVNEEIYQKNIPSALKDILKFCTRATWRLQTGQFIIRPDWNKICEGMVEASIKTMDNGVEEKAL